MRAFRGGEPDLAIEHLARAMRLSPLDPFMFTMQGVTAFAHFFAGRYDEASAWAEKAFWQRPNILATLRISAVSNAFAGRLEEAQKAVARALELDPEMRISNLKDRIGAFRRPEDYAKYAEGLRMAGLPEWQFPCRPGAGQVEGNNPTPRLSSGPLIPPSPLSPSAPHVPLRRTNRANDPDRTSCHASYIAC